MTYLITRWCRNENKRSAVHDRYSRFGTALAKEKHDALGRMPMRLVSVQNLQPGAEGELNMAFGVCGVYAASSIRRNENDVKLTDARKFRKSENFGIRQPRTTRIDRGPSCGTSRNPRRTNHLRKQSLPKNNNYGNYTEVE